jgi:hypothetical protein
MAVTLNAEEEPSQPVQPAHVLHADAPLRAALPATPARVLVKRGDTLTAISARVCGTPRDALALAYNNGVKNPDLIYPGDLIKAACSAAAKAVNAKYGASTRLAARLAAHASQGAGRSTSAPVTDAVSSAPVRVRAATYTGSGSMQRCIISRESGGNSGIWNASGHWGLYQFSASTWAAHGGNPADFGRASVAEQNQVFANTVAQDGYSDWSPYDGC